MGKQSSLNSIDIYLTEETFPGSRHTLGARGVGLAVGGRGLLRGAVLQPRQRAVRDVGGGRQRLHHRLGRRRLLAAVFRHRHHFLHGSVAFTTTHTVTFLSDTLESFRFLLVLRFVRRLAFREASAGAALHVTHDGARACRGLLGRRESARSVDRSRRVGVGAGSQNECGVRVPGVAAPPTRPGIFDALQNHADRRLRVRKGSHPKAEPRVVRAGVIARPASRAPQGQGALIVPAAGTG